MEEEGFREVVTLECLIREFQVRKIVMPSFDPDRPVPLTAGQKRKAEDSDQVWALTQFYSVDFSKSRIGGIKYVCNKRTIKVCVSCC